MTEDISFSVALPCDAERISWPQGHENTDITREHNTFLVAEEVPLALVYNGIDYAVMMITPHDIDDFVMGFCEDVYSAFGMLFTPDLSDTTHALCLKTVTRRLEQLEQLLESNGTDYLLPAGFSQPDALMAVILSWATPLDIDLTAYPKARALRDKVFNRPATQAALKAEGLA